MASRFFFNSKKLRQNCCLFLPKIFPSLKHQHHIRLQHCQLHYGTENIARVLWNSQIFSCQRFSAQHLSISATTVTKQKKYTMSDGISRQTPKFSREQSDISFPSPMRFGVSMDATSSEAVQRVLSLRNASRSEIVKAKVNEAIIAFQERRGDTG